MFMTFELDLKNPFIKCYHLRNSSSCPSCLADSEMTSHHQEAGVSLQTKGIQHNDQSTNTAASSIKAALVVITRRRLQAANTSQPGCSSAAVGFPWGARTHLQFHAVAGVHGHGVGAVQEKAVGQRRVVRGVYVTLWVGEIHHAAGCSWRREQRVQIISPPPLNSFVIPFNGILTGTTLEIPAVCN